MDINNYDTMQLKKEVNILREENERIKSKLFHVEEEYNKKSRILDGFAFQTNGQPGMINRPYKETSIVSSLKKCTKELSLENETLKEDINKLKRDLKITHKNEEESMINMLQQECGRLRSMLEIIINEKNEHEVHGIDEELLTQRAITRQLKEQIGRAHV